MIIRYGEEEMSCLVRRTAAVTGRIRIHVYPDGKVEIEAPEDNNSDQIRAAAQRRARWIFQHRHAALAAQRMSRPRAYVSGETHFYLGRRHKLIVRQTSARPPGVKLLRGKLEVSVPVADPAGVRRWLDTWYSDRATEYLSKRLSEIAGRLNWLRDKPPLKLKRMKTQWGSCSPDGIIYLNPALIKAPRHCIEYVVVHELCHLAEHNHSKAFYDLLTRSMRGWETAKRELDGLAELLLAE